MKTIREQLIGSIQGVVNEDHTQCDGCGAVLFGNTDFDLVTAEHAGEDCMVGARMAAVYLVEHVTGAASPMSHKVVQFLQEQENGAPDEA